MPPAGKLSRRRVGTARTEQLKAAASSSFGVTRFTFQIRVLIERISFFEKQLKETKIAVITENLGSPITAITESGKVIGTVIICEINDISKFNSPRKLVAFADLDATVTQ